MKKTKQYHKKSCQPHENSDPICPKGQHWVRPYERKITKNGKVYIQKVKGYCCDSHCIYQKIADEEKMLLDHLYFALTLYGEARGENDTSKRAIAWVIQNRFTKKMGGNSYQAIVLRKSQFSCWKKSDPNHEKLKHPGKDGTPSDKNAWQKCKTITKEVRNASKDKNPIPEVCHYFSGEPKLKWQKKYFDLPHVPHFHFVKLK